MLFKQLVCMAVKQWIHAIRLLKSHSWLSGTFLSRPSNRDTAFAYNNTIHVQGKAPETA